MTNETKGTPGTLRIVDLRHQKNGQIKLVIDGDHIANVMAKRRRPGTGTAASPDALAWAHLLRAAPETTAALSDLLWAAECIPLATVNARGERCCSYCSATSDTHGPLCIMSRLESGISAARAALAKAEGR